VEKLPLELSNAIDRELAPLHPDSIREACFDLTQRYAKGLGIESQAHRHAYIASRLPATFGAIRSVLRRASPYLSSVNTLLDLGSGVGSLAWAAPEFMPRLKSVTFFERDIEMVRLGQHLTQNKLDPLQISWCHDDVINEKILPTHDAVVLAYVLNEMPFKEQLQVVEKSYNATDQLIIIIEPGTPQGFGNILAARRLLIEMGAQIIAPCTHNNPCPLTPAFKEGKDWCHFSVRIPRGKYHRRAKEGVLPYEDEKFTYLVATPNQVPIPEARIIKAPIKKTGHVILDLCTFEGDLERRIVSKSDGKAYTIARDTEWGDEWEG
jgi:ribosomal protein RSM22 (predicted rRNA methylase)